MSNNSPESPSAAATPARSTHSRRRRPRNRERLRTSKVGVTSLIFVLLNILIWISLRFRWVVVTSGLSAICAFFGFILALVALKQIHRRQGRLQGEGAALIGKWGNLGLLVLSGLLFVYSFTIAIIRGQILN